MSEAEALQRAQSVLGYRFKDQSLLTAALTHASIADHRLNSNERLEFLGDAVLGLVICDELCQRYPFLLEGELTKIKSSVVSRKTCALAAHKLGLVDCLFLGKGMSPLGRLPDSLAAAVLESLIAAFFLDCRDLDLVRKWILSAMDPYIVEAAESDHQHNFKSQLQQYSQKCLGATPGYEVLDEKGPDHHKCFEVCVVINGRRFDSAWGPSKKDAEQKAAYNAGLELDIIDAVEEESFDTDAAVPPFS